MKSIFQVYNIRFTTALHIGNERLDYGSSQKYIHSDMMYAAITSVLANVGYQVPEDGDLGFQISSLFPYYQKRNDDKPVYFFPKLKGQVIPPSSFQHISKKIKKLEWLDLDSFISIINGENLLGTNPENTEKNIRSSFYTRVKDFPEEGFIESEVVPRVQVPRYGIDGAAEDTEPFYMERIFFKDRSGLFFLAIGEHVALIDAALEILKNEGIGTDRTIGQGFFEFEHKTLEINYPESGFCTNLSLFCPESTQQLAEMLGGDSDAFIAYDFKKRGGWITSAPFNTFRKNSIYMFTEGSVFHSPLVTSASKGTIVDLQPKSVVGLDHKIFRSGKAIFIPVKV